MKILAASDLHGDSLQAEKLAELAKKENVDLVVLGGDLTYFGEGTEGLMGPFKKVNKKVLLVPGNHDTIATADFLAELYSPGMYNIHGYSIKFKDIGFVGVGSSHGADASSKEVRAAIEKSFRNLKGVRKKILLTHGVPADEKYENLGMIVDEESTELRKIVEEFQPDVVLCGHMHEFEGITHKIGNTLIHNVGRQGKIIEI